MDDRIYYSFLAMLLAFHTQFNNIMENRSGRWTAGLNELQNRLERPLQSTAYYQDLKELTEIQEQTFALEQDLRRAMIRISRSPHSLSRWRRDLRRLHQNLGILQARLRAEIETLRQSIQQHQRRIIFSRISMLQHQKQLEEQERRGRFSRSCPNISLEFPDSDFCLIKLSSMDEILDFKKEHEGIREMLDTDRTFLGILWNRFMKKEKKTSALHNSFFLLGRRQQGPLRETDHPHWNHTHSRSRHSTDDDGIRRSSAPEQPDHESDSARVRQTALRVWEMARPRAQFNNAAQVATNQTRPSQNDSGIRRSASSAQMDRDSNSPRVNKAKQEKVCTTEVKPVVKSCGSPSFFETNISTAIYKTMTAICATIVMAIYF